MVNQELFTSFLQELAPDENISTVLHYPHPFTRGGFIVVFADDRDNWLQKLSRAQHARQVVASKYQLHCLTPNTLYELSQPGMFTPPLMINEFPHLPYSLNAKGSCLWGDDCRSLVKPYPKPEQLLAGHIEGCLDYLRRYGILMSLMQRQYATLAQILLNEMHYLQGTALLQVGVWDVTMESVAVLFDSAFPGHEAIVLLRDALSIQQSKNGHDERDVHQIVFLFERMLRSFRHDLDRR